MKPFISRPELQYEETEENIAINIPCSPYFLQKDIDKNAAPIDSQSNVIRMTFTNKEEMFAKSFVLIWEFAKRMLFKLNFLLSDRENTDEKVTKPSPPICIKHIIMDWPKIDHVWKVSFKDRPATHVADVAVNRHSKKEGVIPGFEDIGKKRIIAPNIITEMKLRQIVRTGLSVNMFFFFGIWSIAFLPPLNIT